MSLAITKGIEISVVPTFAPKESNVKKDKYVYAYQVIITNKNSYPVRLLKRKWRIFDASGSISLVQGDGVVGQSPIILPGEFHQYSSWAQVNSAIGSMSGAYLMEKDDNDTFWVKIPEFDLIFPGKLN